MEGVKVFDYFEDEQDEDDEQPYPLAEQVISRLSGAAVEKMVMLLVMVKHGRISMDSLVDICSRHHSVDGSKSIMADVVDLYRDGVCA